MEFPDEHRTSEKLDIRYTTRGIFHGGSTNGPQIAARKNLRPLFDRLDSRTSVVKRYRRVRFPRGMCLEMEWNGSGSRFQATSPLGCDEACFALVLIASLSSLSFTTFGWLTRRLLESLEEFRSYHATFVFSSPSRLLLVAFVFIESGYFSCKRYSEVGKLINLEGTERYWFFIDGNLGRAMGRR